jgi:hypothetical protein
LKKEGEEDGYMVKNNKKRYGKKRPKKGNEKRKM